MKRNFAAFSKLNIFLERKRLQFIKTQLKWYYTNYVFIIKNKYYQNLISELSKKVQSGIFYIKFPHSFQENIIFILV